MTTTTKNLTIPKFTRTNTVEPITAKATVTSPYTDYWLGNSCGCRWAKSPKSNIAGILVVPGKHDMTNHIKNDKVIYVETPQGVLTVVEAQ